MILGRLLRAIFLTKEARATYAAMKAQRPAKTAAAPRTTPSREALLEEAMATHRKQQAALAGLDEARRPKMAAAAGKDFHQGHTGRSATRRSRKKRRNSVEGKSVAVHADI